MSKNELLLSGLMSTAIATAALVLSPVASAAEEGARKIDEIVVVAPRITRERTERAGTRRVLTVDRDEAVDSSDLDLTLTADMKALEQRIAEAARRVCEELASEYPLGQPRTPVCIRRAIDDAMAQVDEAMASLTE